jgi:hypothetical protein
VGKRVPTGKPRKKKKEASSYLQPPSYRANVRYYIRVARHWRKIELDSYFEGIDTYLDHTSVIHLAIGELRNNNRDYLIDILKGYIKRLQNEKYR